jgi:hypothetical protein
VDDPSPPDGPRGGRPEAMNPPFPLHDEELLMISIARNRSSSSSSDQRGAGEIVAQAQEYLAEAKEVVKDMVTNRPALALGAALTAGVILGWLIKRR